MRQKLVDHLAARIVAEVETYVYGDWAWILYNVAWAHVHHRRLHYAMKRRTAEARNAARFGL